MSYARAAAFVGASIGWTICILLVAYRFSPEIIVTVDSDEVGTRFAIVSETPLTQEGLVLATPSTFRVPSETMRAVFIAEGKDSDLTVTLAKRGWRAKASAVARNLRAVEVDVASAGVMVGPGWEPRGSVIRLTAAFVSRAPIQFDNGLVCTGPTTRFYAIRGLVSSARMTCEAPDGSA